MQLAIRRVLGRRRSQDQEEVEQRAWIALLTALERFEGRADLRTFAYKTALQQAQQYIFGEWRLVPVDFADPALDDGISASQLPPPHQLTAAQRYWQRLYAHLEASVPPEDLLCLKLRFVDGFSSKETARIVGISPSYVDLKIFRLKRLAAEFREQEGDWRIDA
jgi:RNA polymerase sigma-70 factor (ECF subfamily)